MRTEKPAGLDFRLATNPRQVGGGLVLIWIRESDLADAARAPRAIRDHAITDPDWIRTSDRRIRNPFALSI